MGIYQLACTGCEVCHRDKPANPKEEGGNIVNTKRLLTLIVGLFVTFGAA
jgi:hypothetical protein